MVEPFDHDLANFSLPKKADSRFPPNLTPASIAEHNTNEIGVKWPAVANDDMMAFIEGHWREFFVYFNFPITLLHLYLSGLV
jgi:hypothetical protein